MYNTPHASLATQNDTDRVESTAFEQTHGSMDNFRFQKLLS